jgi:hypothetical protein
MIKCPLCQTEILVENVNIQTDIARCHKCENIFKISEVISIYDDKPFNIDSPPKGAWIIKDIDQVKIGATTRSGFAFFLVPFMIVWSGGAIGGIYVTQIMEGKFELFQSLIGIPFILGAILFWSITLMTIWGKVEVTFDKLGGTAFTGVGKFGIKKQFRWDEVDQIIERRSKWNNKENNQTAITMQGATRISFGSGLSDSRKYYLMRSLQVYQNKIKNRRGL